jgi:hypothetical protein
MSRYWTNANRTRTVFSGVLLSITLAVLILAIGGCMGPDENDWTESRPKVADVVGVYSYDGDSVHTYGKLPAKPGQVMQLQLLANGTFTATSVPVELATSSNSSVVLRSGVGTWAFDTPFSDDSQSQGIKLEFNNASNDTCFTALSHQKAPYEIVFMIGDWDQRDAVWYKKVK